MGLPLKMDTLHAPTVPSGLSSTAAATNGRAGQMSFAELQHKKDNLEAELKALGGVLDSVHIKAVLKCSSSLLIRMHAAWRGNGHASSD